MNIQMPPRAAPLLFLGTAHAALAFAFGLAAWWPRAVAGFFYHSWMAALVHLVAPPLTGALRMAAAYGVLGLVGFLAQMVVAMEIRLLPLVAWCWAYAGSGYREPPLSPHRMHNRGLQVFVLAGWIVGVPALAAGLALESAQCVAVGAAALFAAVGVAGVDHARVLAVAHRPSQVESATRKETDRRCPVPARARPRRG
jgi:hypothetical protein